MVRDEAARADDQARCAAAARSRTISRTSGPSHGSGVRPGRLPAHVVVSAGAAATTTSRCFVQLRRIGIAGVEDPLRQRVRGEHDRRAVRHFRQRIVTARFEEVTYAGIRCHDYTVSTASPCSAPAFAARSAYSPMLNRE